MSENHACAATPKAELERQIMNPNFPKNEREWWAASEIERLRERQGWQPIETASAGILLLYFPAITGRNANTEMIRVDHFPVAYPRKPSHWMHLPSPPKP